MNLSRYFLKLRQLRHHNQELVYQSLYKAQNLGFYQNIYAGDLIERYAETVARADTYASAGSFRRARRTLGGRLPAWDFAAPAPKRKARIAISAPSNLAALALLAQVHAAGWSLVIEDCPFTRRFVQPVAKRDGVGAAFAPFSLIPKLIRSASGADVGEPYAYVTFPDRPFDGIKGSMPARLLGRDYLLSIAEALLTRAPVDRVFRLGRILVEVAHRPTGANTISGAEISGETQEQAVALEAAMLDAPLEYLGWESLYSRSQMYFDLVNENVRSLYQCLLRYSQLNGSPLRPALYAGLMAEFAGRETRA